MPLLQKVIFAFGLVVSVGLIGGVLFEARYLQPPRNANQGVSQSGPGKPVTVPAPVQPSLVVALGAIEPRSGVLRVAGPSNATGARVARLEVVEGDTVAAGDVLAVLDTEAGLAAALAQAKAETDAKALSLQRARLEAHKTEESLKATADQQRAERDRAQAELETLERLVRGGVYEKAALLDKQLTVQSADEKLRAAEFEWRYAAERTAAGDTFDVASAALTLENAKAALAKAEADHAQSTIVAPSNGIVLSVYAEAGEQLDSNRLLQLADTSRMEVRAEVFESDIGRIAVGQAASVASQILEPPLSGTVRWVGQSVERQTLLSDDPAANTDNRVVTVRVALDAASGDRAARFINHQVRVTFEEPKVARLEDAGGSQN